MDPGLSRRSCRPPPTRPHTHRSELARAPTVFDLAAHRFTSSGKPSPPPRHVPSMQAHQAALSSSFFPLGKEGESARVLAVLTKSHDLLPLFSFLFKQTWPRHLLQLSISSPSANNQSSLSCDWLGTVLSSSESTRTPPCHFRFGELPCSTHTSFFFWRITQSLPMLVLAVEAVRSCVTIVFFDFSKRTYSKPSRFLLSGEFGLEPLASLHVPSHTCVDPSLNVLVSAASHRDNTSFMFLVDPFCVDHFPLACMLTRIFL